MKLEAEEMETSACELARKRLISVKRDPFLIAEWANVAFLHFVIEPNWLRSQVLQPFELELYEGRGVISVVSITMRHFRPCRVDPLALPFTLVQEQQFLNLRTYVRYQNEPGALFLHGWLSRPFAMPLPSRMLGLPFTFAATEKICEPDTLREAVSVTAHASHDRFAYAATMPAETAFTRCSPGSLAEFAMERYSGFFSRGVRPFVFRAWHPPWMHKAITPNIAKTSLITRKFPWFKNAEFAGGNFSPGFSDVWLGWAHHLKGVRSAKFSRRRVLSSFYEMP